MVGPTDHALFQSIYFFDPNGHPHTRGADEIMVIGGAEIYAGVMSQADRIYLTRVHGAPEGDKHFATPDPALWCEVSREALPQGPKDEYASTLIVFERTAAASSLTAIDPDA